jgi:hypothetical protein
MQKDRPVVVPADNGKARLKLRRARLLVLESKAKILRSMRLRTCKDDARMQSDLHAFPPLTETRHVRGCAARTAIASPLHAPANKYRT